MAVQHGATAEPSSVESMHLEDTSLHSTDFLPSLSQTLLNIPLNS